MKKAPYQGGIQQQRTIRKTSTMKKKERYRAREKFENDRIKQILGGK